MTEHLVSSNSSININKNANIPLYVQIADAIKEAIESGNIQHNSPLLPERAFAEELAVSRVTMRKAIAALEEQKYCVKRPGSGTFALNPKQAASCSRLPQSMAKLRSFTQDMEEKGLNPSSKLISSQIGLANAEETLALGLKQQEVHRINRVRLSNGEPMSYDICAIPVQILGDDTEITASVYSAMQAAGHAPVRAIQRINACALDNNIAQLLQVENGSVAMAVQRISYDQNDQAVEFTRSYYLAERFDFVAELWAENSK
ncbi:GntR family transcriptional regulator [uncultured Pseudoteredinibacter sp.]|uniref:GntR family transcriptional regulator n=1 Tax=uncultured Pseudoteredinibacter sp. TaxID=1641701 RepID=UPI0026209B60|nr:GntR family transcriptional regulator [uncultured Pseudoteredinibacter sp.]